MTTTRAPHRYAALVALAACCATSACSTGNNATPAAPPPPPPPPASAPTSVPAEPSSPPSTPALASPARNVPPSEARDGTNIAACRTGRCQIAVHLPATIQIGSKPLTFTLDDGYLAMTVHDPGFGDASLTAGVGGNFSTSQPGGPNYSIRVLGLTGNTAVLDITKQ